MGLTLEYMTTGLDYDYAGHVGVNSKKWIEFLSMLNRNLNNWSFFDLENSDVNFSYQFFFESKNISYICIISIKWYYSDRYGKK